MFFKLFSFLFLFAFSISAQEITVNIGVDESNPERREIITLWKNYLKSDPDKPDNSPAWCEADKRRYKSYDLLKSEGFLTPSLYYFQLDNKILSLTKTGDDYVIRSAFYKKDTYDIFAISNVAAAKTNGKFCLTNHQSVLTKDWPSRKIGYFTYRFFAGYELNPTKAEKANAFLVELCTAFSITPAPIEYFICRDCDHIATVKGFDYVMGMGNGKECGFFDEWNAIIYATANAGENHQHEITHFINPSFPNAHPLLLMGLSAYWGDENAHKGKPFLFHVGRVNDYLKAHAAVDLNRPSDF